MNVSCYNTEEAWHELQPHWNALLARSEANSIFLTWEWLQAWWHAYCGARELFILIASEGSSILGIAPLYREPQRLWGKQWHCLRFIGHGSNDSDYLSLIIERGREPDVTDAFLEHLRTCDRRWDLAEFDGPFADSRVLSALQSGAAAQGWTVSQDVIPCAALSLPAAWPDYLSLLRPRFRTKVRATLSFFEKRLRVAPQACSSPEQIDAWLPLLFDLHTRRWQGSGQPGVFRDLAKQQFYREIANSALQNGWLAFHRLDWSDRPLALQYGFNYQNRFYLLQEGYDPDYEQVRPGVALRGFLIRQWIQQGLSEYDFLAGQARYKMDWGAQGKSAVRLRIAHDYTGALAHFRVPSLKESGKRIVRSITPDAVLEWRKRVLEGRRARPWRQTSDGYPSSTMVHAFAKVYTLAPVRAVGRRVADGYQAHHTGHGIALARRTEHLCQIMMFHRINDDGDPFLPATGVSVFREQMRYLARNYRMVSLDDVATGAAFEGDRKFSVAVTFDDGYRDNFLNAFPILQEFKIPATIFLATQYVDQGELPWYDRVFLAFKLSQVDHLSLTDISGPSGATDPLPARLALLGRVLRWLRDMNEGACREALAVVFRELQVDAGLLAMPNPMLAWDDIRQMHKQGITFGGHTVSHPVLAGLSATRLREELHGCKERIESRLQTPVRHFAYPFGSPAEVSPQAVAVVCDEGFKTAVTTTWGFNRSSTDKFALRRCNPWENDFAVFALKCDWNRLFSEPDPNRPARPLTEVEPRPARNEPGAYR